MPAGGPNMLEQTCGVFVDVEVDFRDQANFLFAYIHDMSSTGIFVRTTTPEQPGTRLNLRFRPDGVGPELELDGKVIWINPYRPNDSNNLSPGMGIHLLDITREQRSRLIHLVKRFAYLCDDSAAT